jgi:sugar phosphate isomerase/epimerase
MTRLGISTYAFAWAIGVTGYPPEAPMDSSSFLHRAAELGVYLVQIADNLPLDRLSAAEFDSLVGATRHLGIAVEVGTRGIDYEHLRTYLQIALRFQSPILRVVVDTKDHHPDPDEISKRLKAIMPEFEQAGVILAIENHDRFKARTLVQIIESVNSSSIGICLDTVNSFGALEAADVVVDALGPFVVNLHIKDFMIRRADHNLGFVIEGTPAGWGMLHIPGLLKRLENFNRNFNAVLELWPSPESTIQATIDKEAAWVSQSISYLRTLIKE